MTPVYGTRIERHAQTLVQPAAGGLAIPGLRRIPDRLGEDSLDAAGALHIQAGKDVTRRPVRLN